jgi:hypothetical protein
MGEQAQFGPVERRLRRGIYRCTYEFSSGEFVDARLEYLNLGTRTWTGTPDNKNKRTAGESVNLFRGWMGRVLRGAGGFASRRVSVQRAGYMPSGLRDRGHGFKRNCPASPRKSRDRQSPDFVRRDSRACDRI